MEILASDDARSGRRPPQSLPAIVLVALALLGAAQIWAVLQPRPLPAATSVQALPNGYSYGTDGDRATIGFQMRNDGDRALQVVDIGGELPGLQVVDVIASGAPFDFGLAGAGPEPLPSFELPAGAVVEISLVYRVLRCSDVPSDQRPLAVAVETGGAQGRLQMPLPGAPAERLGAGPDDEDPWQQVLVRDVCD